MRDTRNLRQKVAMLSMHGQREIGILKCFDLRDAFGGSRSNVPCKIAISALLRFNVLPDCVLNLADRGIMGKEYGTM